MNLKFINRKQQLGISHPYDYFDWTIPLEGANLGNPQVVDIRKMAFYNGHYTDNFTYNELEELEQELATAATDFANEDTSFISDEFHSMFNYKKAQTENTKSANFIREFNNECRDLGRGFYMMEFRPIDELGENTSIIEMLDKMVTDCGCNAIGDNWVEYSPSDGHETLSVFLERNVFVYHGPALRPQHANALSNKLLSQFRTSVRYFGNDERAPWKESRKSWPQGGWSGAFGLQSLRNNDFGLVLCDDKHVCMLLDVYDHM